LFRDRKIDSVEIAHLIRHFSFDSQKKIAQEVIRSNLKLNDIKILSPLSKQLPNMKINELIERVISSKDIKVYILYFQIPEFIKDKELLKNVFQEYIDINEIIFLILINGVAKMGLSKSGLQKLRALAKEKKLTLRKFVSNILKK